MFDPMAFKAHRLANGMEVRFQRRDLGWFGCSLMVRAGSRDDPPGKEELAHLLEHLLSSGTEGLPRMTLVELERWLASQHYELDLGVTELDHMTFTGKAPVAKLGGFLRLLHDLTLRPTLDSDLDKERDIIRREREEADDPDDRAAMRVRGRALYGGHRLGDCGLWTEDAGLDVLTLDDVRAMHVRHFDPSQMSLVVVGGLKEDALLKDIEAAFAARQGFVPPTRVGAPPFLVPDPRENLRTKEAGRVHKVDVSYEWLLPSAPAGAPAQLVCDALEESLCDRIREKLRATYGVHVAFDSFMDHRTLSIETQVTPKRVAQVREIIDAALRDADAVAADLPRLRDDTLRSLGFLEMSVDETLERAVEELNAYGKTRTIAEVMRTYASVDEAEVRSLMTDRLTPERAFVETKEE